MAGTMELDLKTNVTRGMVSMKSGLDGRNNGSDPHRIGHQRHVSMKSGLDGRNNKTAIKESPSAGKSLNEVRPRWPEQSEVRRAFAADTYLSQ